MRHLIFFYHIAAFLSGISVVLLAAIGYLKFRKQVYKNYFLFTLSLTLFLIDQTGASYKLVSLMSNGFSDIILSLVTAIGYAIMIYSLPRFTHEFLDVEIDEKRKDLFSILALVLPTSAVLLYYTMSWWIIPAITFNGIMVGSVIYAIWTAKKNYKNIESDERRTIIKRFMMLTFICIPYISTDMFIEKLPVVGSYFPYGIISVPTFYLLWNCLTLYYIIRFFNNLMLNFSQNEPVNVESAEPFSIDAFAEQYGITNREKEVAELIEKGYSYNRICEELVISMPTVKSHIYNLYQKTGVKNRVELINKMHQKH